jgi:hypothetical protein
MAKPVTDKEKKLAFEHYFAMGLTGTLTINQRMLRIAEKFGRDRTTVYKWKKDDMWDLKEELKYDMIEVARENLSPESLAVLESDLLNILNQIVTEYLAYVMDDDGSIMKIRNPLDFKRVIEAKNALVGGPPKKETKDVNHTGTVAVIVGDKDLLNSLMEIQESGDKPVQIHDGVEAVEGGTVEEADGGRLRSAEDDGQPPTS